MISGINVDESLLLLLLQNRNYSKACIKTYFILEIFFYKVKKLSKYNISL